MKLITEIDFKWKHLAILGLLTVFIGMIAGMFGLKTVWDDILLACVVIAVTLDTIFTTIRLYDGFRYDFWKVATYKDKFDHKIMKIVMIWVGIDFLLRDDSLYVVMGVAILYTLIVDFLILRKCKED